GAAEVPDGARGAGEAEGVGGRLNGRRDGGAAGGLGVEEFLHRACGQFIGEAGGGALQDAEGAGRDFDDGDTDAVRVAQVGGGDGGDAVGGALIKEGVFDEGAGGEDAGDGALDDALGVLGVLDLVA